jgi:hypothetical protein
MTEAALFCGHRDPASPAKLPPPPRDIPLPRGHFCKYCAGNRMTNPAQISRFNGEIA